MAPKADDKPKDKGKEESKPKSKDGGKGPKQDKIDRDQIEEDYGLSYALFKAFPELNDLLKEAIAGNWTAAKFQVELRQTKWFAKHSDIWRENTALSFSDPATFTERLENVKTGIINMMGSVGATLSDAGVEKLAKRALLFGMSDDQIRDVLANHIKPSDAGHYTGDLASIEQDLRNTAMLNGVTLRDDQFQKWMKAIVSGSASTDQYVTNIREMAAKQFSLYGQEIRGGMDLADIASPYIQSMSQILELNPMSINLNDPTIRRALGGTRDASGKVLPTSITDFEDTLRKDSRYLYTKTATRQAEGFAARLAQMWGLQ